MRSSLIRTHNLMKGRSMRSPSSARGVPSRPVYAGKDELAKALKLIADGKPIRYEGVIGPVNFDQFGDISGPFRLWQVVDGKVTTVGEMSTADVEKLKAGMK